jgi:tellurite resistance protein TerA
MPIGRGSGSSAEPGSFATRKITLTRTAPVVSLTKQGAATGTLRVNLNWAHRYVTGPSRKPSTGLFRPLMVQPPSQMRTIDLDLGCFYELSTGAKGVVQALGNLFGSFDRPPYVFLDGDDRSGTGSGENLFINFEHAADIRRLLVFAYIYDETPAFDRANGIVTLIPAAGPRVEVRLDEKATGAKTCAVVLIENRGREVLVRREVRYVNGFQAELDRMYGWGLRWTRGYK